MNTTEMDKYERRRLRLMELRDTRCNGKAVTLAEKIGRSPSYVSRMLYPAGKKAKKRIQDELIEAIETAFNLPHGWLDQEPGTPDKTPSTHRNESIRTVIELMEGTTEKTRIEICGIVRGFLISVNPKDETPQKITGLTGTHS